VRFGQTNHRLELTGRGGNSTFLSSNVFAQFSHGHVGADEGVGGGLGYRGVDVGASVGDVGGEELDGLESGQISLCTHSPK
jgi:hypothetical protein